MRVATNGIEIECELHGAASAVPMLFIMGLGMQLTAWPDDLLKALGDKGFRPITFDNRDIGLSTKFDTAGMPNLLSAAMRQMVGLKVRSPYLLSDMANDALGLLDALNISKCHIVGASMGGMIAQHLAAAAPERVQSLSLIMTTSGARGLPGPAMKARRALLSRPASSDVEARIAHAVGIWRVIGSPGYPATDAELRAKVERGIRRSYYAPGVARQLVAVVASGDRTPLLPQISAPTVVLHGRDDPLVPVACGVDLAQKIGGATLELFDGMGHDMPAALIPRLAELITANAARDA
jgi:pimeloyl-ACP methyl ester carboxylesterase